MNAVELYAAMCRFAEDHGYRRRSPDEGGWWDHEDDDDHRSDMTIGEVVEEEFLRQKIDTRIPPEARPREARPDWTMGVPPEQWPENSEAPVPLDLEAQQCPSREPHAPHYVPGSAMYRARRCPGIPNA